MTTSTNQADPLWMDLFKGWQQASPPFDQQMTRLLQAGLHHLQLEVAILSRIKDRTYTVEHFVGGGLHAGQTFELGHTYCSITINYNHVLGIHHMGISPHFRHPCYEAFQIETYIGTPVYHNGQLYGTVNFSSPTPRNEPFSDEQRVFVQLIGEAVNWALLARAAVADT